MTEIGRIGMDAYDKQQVLLCFAWAGLRHWNSGRQAGDAAWDVVEVKLDAMRGRLDLGVVLCDLENELLDRLACPPAAPL